MRKTAGHQISDRVRVAIAADAGTIERLLPHREWLADELLADSVELASDAVIPDATGTETLELEGALLRLSVGRS